MKVLLKEDVDNLGYAGEVYDVADGYGRNFLIPQGMAVKASPNVMKQASAWRKKAEARREEMRAEHEALSTKIEDTKLVFTARAGDTGKLYGSITTSQITDSLNEELGTDIDRRKVGIEPLRQLGEHQVIVRLSADFQPHVTVRIESEDGQIITADEFEEVEVDIVEEDVVEELEEVEIDIVEEDVVEELEETAEVVSDDSGDDSE